MRRPGARGLCVALALALAGCALGASRLAGWQAQAVALRGLEFVRPVGLRWIEPRDISRIGRAEITAAYPAEYIEGYRDAYAALGVLPPGFDLLEVLLDLQADQYIGIYSAQRQTLFVLRNLPPGGYGTDTVVIHELVHALQHQHFPRTIELLQSLHHNDDVVMAVGSAVEGDASLTMLGVPERGVPTGRDLATAKRLSDGLLIELVEPSGMLARVPNMLRTSVIFPYAYGTVAAAQAYAGGENLGLNSLVGDPPLSTRAVVELDDAPTEFIALPLDALRAELAPRGCVAGHHNVAGLLTLRVLFEDHREGGPGEALAEILAGWRGDRFLHVDCPDGWELVWITRWESEAAAGEFALRYAAIADSVQAQAGLSGAPVAIADGRTVRVLTPGLAGLAGLLEREVETRSYDSFEAWVADECFPESPCPESGDG